MFVIMSFKHLLKQNLDTQDHNLNQVMWTENEFKPVWQSKPSFQDKSNTRGEG